MYSLSCFNFFKSNQAANQDDEEGYDPDVESGNEEELDDDDDISDLVDDSSFLNDKSEEVPNTIDEMPKTGSNISAVTEGFAKMHVRGDDFLTEFRSPFIQYSYTEDDQKYIDINFPVMTFPKEMFRPAVVDGGKGFELGILCPKLLSKKLRLAPTKDVDRNSNQVISFKEISNKMYVAHDWFKGTHG